MRGVVLAVMLLFGARCWGQDGAAFEVATVKPVDPAPKSGRFLKMETDRRFVARNFPVKLLLAAAYDLPPKAISGGPAWMDSDLYDIEAVTPGQKRPSRNEQMAMLRALLVDRFQLKIHREPKEFAIYVLSVAKGGPKLRPSNLPADAPSNVICTVYPERITLPARNVTLDEVTKMMQRAIFDRPVVDKTGVTGRYDFDLSWAPDETQFGGQIPPATTAATDPPLFLALQEQVGLRLESTRGPISTLVVDRLERPSAN